MIPAAARSMQNDSRHKLTGRIVAALTACILALPASIALAQQNVTASGVLEPDEDGKVQIDFDDAPLRVIIDAIAKLTKKNFIYDDRVKGKVTIISPAPVSIDEAWAVFESVLKVKGFTAVSGPGGVYKIIPVRDAKESNIETIRDVNRISENRDQFVTRLIPLYYIDAVALTSTIKPLVSKDASMVVYSPTNTIILTDTKANIRRLLGIFEALDVETHKEELAVIKILYADAGTLGSQISQIYGGTSSGTRSTAAAARRDRAQRRNRAQSGGTAGATSLEAMKRGEVRIITESRTNSLIIMAARNQIADIRGLIRKLDVPVVGGGQIHVYYLKHADSEEMTNTLQNLISGAGRGGGTRAAGGGAAAGANARPQALRSMVTPLSQGAISLSADPATNSLVILASREAYETLVQVIESLDIPRPQVLVEALIMEIDITNSLDLGFNILFDIMNGDTTMLFQGAALAGTSGVTAAVSHLSGNDTFKIDMQAAATDNRINIVSAPHILTSDNEEAEIRIGDNIPIITSRIESASGATIAGLSTSVNVERKDIGVTLRVTPQISEGNMLRLKIFQELTEVNDALTQDVAGGDPNNTAAIGVALSNRRIENTVVVADGETVVIAGLISEVSGGIQNKVPFLGDIPFLGWFFKSEANQTRRVNLILMLTPHIVRNAADLERETIRKRAQFANRTHLSHDLDQLEEDVLRGRTNVQGESLAEDMLLEHQIKYPIERMSEIEMQRQDERNELEAARAAALAGPRYLIQAAVHHEEDASEILTEVIDLGYDATLVSEDVDGRVELELRVGPFGTLREADSTATILRRAMELEPEISLVPQDPSSETGPGREPQGTTPPEREIP